MVTPDDQTQIVVGGPLTGTQTNTHRDRSSSYPFPPPPPPPSAAATLHLLAPIHPQHHPLFPPPPTSPPPRSYLYSCHCLHWLSGDGQVHFRQRSPSSFPPSIHRRIPSFLSISPAPVPPPASITPLPPHRRLQNADAGSLHP